tara:strand:+ start:291 stop:581 length:291 start_codon:yes stop_codon:yes gene_type:complete
MSTVYKQVNGVKVALTSEELTAKAKAKTVWNAGATERQKDKLRVLREPLLQEADFAIFKLEDSGKDTTQWRKYRQDLRDITGQSDVFNATFPTKPS